MAQCSAILPSGRRDAHEHPYVRTAGGQQPRNPVAFGDESAKDHLVLACAMLGHRLYRAL
jgi:hypothetical protein